MNTDVFFLLFCEFLLKSVSILLLALVVAGVWRHASAAWRSLVWTIAVLALLSLPLTRLATPLWKVELPPTMARVVLPSTPNSAAGPVPDSRLASSASVREWQIPSWRAQLLFFWLVGTGVILGSRIPGLRRLYQLRRQGKPATDERILALCRSVTAEFGLADRSEVYLLPDGCSPLVWGFWRARIFLPEAASTWSMRRLQTVLCHELGHIRRQDCIIRLLALLACSIYWPNPLIWFAARRLRVAQEQACDDLVLRNGADASDYADFLVRTAQSLGRNRPALSHVLSMAQPSTLAVRVQAIMDAQRNRLPLNRKATTAGAIVLMGLAAASALARMQDMPDLNTTQVEIVARFVGISGGRMRHTDLDRLFDSIQAVETRALALSESQEKVVQEALSGTEGVKVLSTPRVLTVSKQQAVVRIVEEINYASAWRQKQNTGSWEPTAYETKETGMTFTVTPEVRSDDLVSLELAPEITELAGYVDPDEGKKTLYPAGKVPTGHRSEPVFTSRKLAVNSLVRSGQSLAMALPPQTVTSMIEGQAGETLLQYVSGTADTRTLVFVTARIVEPDGKTGKTAAVPAGTQTEMDAMKKAASLIAPNLEFEETPLTTIVEYLVEKSREIDAEKKGVNIVLDLPPDVPSPVITLNLQNIPLSEALRYIALASGLELVRDARTLRLQPKTTGPAN